MFKLLALVFILIPALDIYILFQFGSAFGGLNTLFLVIATGLIGAALAKREGLTVINKIQSDLSSNKLPANDMISALLVFGGGLLLLTPGFVTDIFGLTMILPFSRIFYISIFKNLFQRGILGGSIKVFTSNRFQSRNPQSPPSTNIDNVIEAEFKEKS